MQEITENLEHIKKSVEMWNFSIANYFVGETLELISDVMEVKNVDKNYLNSFRAIASFIKSEDNDWKIGALRKARSELRESEGLSSKNICENITALINNFEKERDFRKDEWRLSIILAEIKKECIGKIDEKYLKVIEKIANYYLSDRREDKLNALK